VFWKHSSFHSIATIVERQALIRSDRENAIPDPWRELIPTIATQRMFPRCYTKWNFGSSRSPEQKNVARNAMVAPFSANAATPFNGRKTDTLRLAIQTGSRSPGVQRDSDNHLKQQRNDCVDRHTSAVPKPRHTTTI
jgi:hypothetical protein